MRAAESPLFVRLMMRMRGSRAAYRERISGLLSVEPSSMQMISISAKVCPVTLSRHWGRNFSTLKTGMITEICGGFMAMDLRRR